MLVPSGGDGSVVVQHAFLVFFQSVRELFKHADAVDSGAGEPILEDSASGAFVGLLPDLPKVFLDVVVRLI